jgi:hypothetical protein
LAVTVLNLDTPVTTEFRYKRKDDTWCWVEATGTNLLTEPDVKALVINYHDITERKRAEEEIKLQLDELQRWHTVTLGRENRILELKREVNDLLSQTGQPLRYPSAESDNSKES